MAAPTIFRSSDASAPVLHGNVGSLIAVLDGCLVNGYGSKAALGWAKAFAGTNLASYRAAAGARHYLDVDDSGPDATALGRNARCRGYEAMTAVATGTLPFPTVTQVATPIVTVKSGTVGTTARPWILIGDDRTFYFFNEPQGVDPPNLASHVWTCAFFFGEILSNLTGDLYRSILGYCATSTAIVSSGMDSWANLANVGATTLVNQNMPRTYTGSSGSIWVGPVGSGNTNTGSHIGIGSLTAFPNPVDGGIFINTVSVYERGSGTTAVASLGGPAFRGRYRGLYQAPYAGAGFSDQDTFSGAGDFAGRTFIILKATGGGQYILETTAWPASS